MMEKFAALFVGGVVLGSLLGASLVHNYGAVRVQRDVLCADVLSHATASDSLRYIRAPYHCTIEREVTP